LYRTKRNLGLRNDDFGTGVEKDRNDLFRRATLKNEMVKDCECGHPKRCASLKFVHSDQRCGAILSPGIGAGLELVAIMNRLTLWTFSNDKSLVAIDRQHIRISTGDIRGGCCKTQMSEAGQNYVAPGCPTSDL